MVTNTPDAVFFQGKQLVINRHNTIGSWPSRRIHSQPSFDPWEVAMGDLTIHEHEPLGKGCYGEVYKGTITGRRQRSGSRKGPRSPRFSLTNTVAVKRLQSKCLGITSLIILLFS